MGVEIIKIYREHVPAHRLIGKRYLDSDRVNDGFGAKWEEWFRNGWLGELEKIAALPEYSGTYLGVMRDVGNIFEYWIGMFFPEGTPAPDGFVFADIAAGDIATCWIYGNEGNGELFGMGSHMMCMDKIAGQGWILQEDGWFFERYDPKRFTKPDDKGNVILDYCAYIK